VNAPAALDGSHATWPVLDTTPWPSSNMKRDTNAAGPFATQPDCQATGAPASALARPKKSPASSSNTENRNGASPPNPLKTQAPSVASMRAAATVAPSDMRETATISGCPSLPRYT
jgi:hypothetical protein